MRDQLKKTGLLLLFLALFMLGVIMQYPVLKSDLILVGLLALASMVIILLTSMIGRRRSSGRTRPFLFYAFPIVVVFILFGVLLRM